MGTQSKEGEIDNQSIFRNSNTIPVTNKRSQTIQERKWNNKGTQSQQTIQEREIDNQSIQDLLSDLLIAEATKCTRKQGKADNRK